MTTLETTHANPNHDAAGRFKPGNKGGPGNPFGGKVSLFRQAIFACVTVEDMQAIGKTLIKMAIEGHWQAAKLILTYAVGKPQQAMTLEEADRILAEPPEPPPSTNGISSLSARAEPSDEAAPTLDESPSPNGEIEPTSPSTHGDFSPPLNRQQRRALRKAQRLAKQKRNSPPPVLQPAASVS